MNAPVDRFTAEELAEIQAIEHELQSQIDRCHSIGWLQMAHVYSQALSEVHDETSNAIQQCDREMIAAFRRVQHA